MVTYCFFIFSPTCHKRRTVCWPNTTRWHLQLASFVWPVIKSLKDIHFTTTSQKEKQNILKAEKLEVNEQYLIIRLVADVSAHVLEILHDSFPSLFSSSNPSWRSAPSLLLSVVSSPLFTQSKMRSFSPFTTFFFTPLWYFKFIIFHTISIPLLNPLLHVQTPLSAIYASPRRLSPSCHPV